MLVLPETIGRCGAVLKEIPAKVRSNFQANSEAIDGIGDLQAGIVLNTSPD